MGMEKDFLIHLEVYGGLGGWWRRVLCCTIHIVILLHVTNFLEYFRIAVIIAKMTSRLRGSPIIKTVFQPKRRKLVPVVAPSSISEWSTIGQDTTTGMHQSRRS